MEAANEGTTATQGEATVVIGETKQAVVPIVEGMRCPICDGKSWHNLGKVAEDKSWPDLRVCSSCAFIAYDVREEDEAKLLQFYRADYRSAPGHKNLITTTTKQNYIMRALAPILDKAKAEKRQLVCGDWGCATGYIPAALRRLGHRATGSEYTRGFRRFAEAFYGVAVAEELPEKHPYDLITCYHVLEHMVAPDKKLAKMVSLLKDDGRILISVPEWLADLEIQSGEPLTGRGHYYHKNHINAFTSSSLKRLFAKAGLVIESEDHVTYGQTYILRKVDAGFVSDSGITENPTDILERIGSTIKAIDLYGAGKFREAVTVYPAFPEAWLGIIYGMYGKDVEAQAAHFKKASEALPNNTRLYTAFGAWLFQREKFDEAEVVHRRILDVKPNPDALMKLGWCALHKGDHERAMEAFLKVAELHPPSWTEAMELVCKAASMLPHWEERAQVEAAKMFSAQAATLKVSPKDPGFDAV